MFEVTNRMKQSKFAKDFKYFFLLQTLVIVKKICLKDKNQRIYHCYLHEYHAKHCDIDAKEKYRLIFVQPMMLIIMTKFCII